MQQVPIEIIETRSICIQSPLNPFPLTAARDIEEEEAAAAAAAVAAEDAETES